MGRRIPRLAVPAATAVLLVIGAWWFWPRSAVSTPQAAKAAETPAQPAPPARLPEIRFADPPKLAADAHRDATSAADDQSAKPQDGGAKPPATQSAPLSPRVAAAIKQAESGQIIEGRRELNQLLAASKDDQERATLRAHLARIADETVFSTKPFAGDPLIEQYKVQSGDNLINIGKRFDVPAEVVMLVNGIRNPNGLAVGKTIKVPHGPFHARVSSGEFRMDVYLQDLYVRSYPVGLGANGTPQGLWLVNLRQRDPAYYPPASDAVKKVIYPGDPDYPLGGYWLALEGVEGDAVGRQGFGIHGTNKPESIGKAESLGCVRLRNEDVKIVYGMLMPGKSKVTVLP